MTRTSTSATTECDVFFVRKILQIALFVNFCACPFPRVKYKGDVLGHQLFEAYLPSLLHRLYKQRRWRASKIEDDKKVKRPCVNDFASASFQSQEVGTRALVLLILWDLFSKTNKTQLCKRLAAPIIPLSWSGLV